MTNIKLYALPEIACKSILAIIHLNNDNSPLSSQIVSSLTNPFSSVNTTENKCVTIITKSTLDNLCSYAKLNGEDKVMKALHNLPRVKKDKNGKAYFID